MSEDMELHSKEDPVRALVGKLSLKEKEEDATVELPEAIESKEESPLTKKLLSLLDDNIDATVRSALKSTKKPLGRKVRDFLALFLEVCMEKKLTTFSPDYVALLCRPTKQYIDKAIRQEIFTIWQDHINTFLKEAKRPLNQFCAVNGDLTLQFEMFLKGLPYIQSYQKRYEGEIVINGMCSWSVFEQDVRRQFGKDADLSLLCYRCGMPVDSSFKFGDPFSSCCSQYKEFLPISKDVAKKLLALGERGSTCCVVCFDSDHRSYLVTCASIAFGGLQNLRQDELDHFNDVMKYAYFDPIHALDFAFIPLSYRFVEEDMKSLSRCLVVSDEEFKVIGKNFSLDMDYQVGDVLCLYQHPNIVVTGKLRAAHPSLEIVVDNMEASESILKGSLWLKRKDLFLIPFAMQVTRFSNGSAQVCCLNKMFLKFFQLNGYAEGTSICFQEPK